MDPLVAQRLNEVVELCRRFRVRRLDLFGSGATGSFDPATSDLDFLVEFDDLHDGEWADAYFGLLEALENLFGRSVDLVMPSAIKNPYLHRSIAATKTVLYAA